jgi:hypothetical protein
MFYILTASADTYITNKVIDNKFKATDANVGRAGTLDLFKLWDESTYMSASTRVTSSVDELSRILIKFDYDKVAELASSSLDTNHPSFNVTLELFEAVLGAPVPEDFKIVAYPLSRSWAEGSGRNIAQFTDIDAANFLTASYGANNVSLWNTSGSGARGFMGDTDIDYMISGTIDNKTPPSIIDFGSTQYFRDGPGKLSLDVTNVVSASIANIVQNHGFRITYSGSYESDRKTRFVKRFASRHARNPLIQPRLVFTWDDSIQDKHKGLLFNVSSSLFLRNLTAGRPAALVSGSSLTKLQGQDCVMLRFVSSSGDPSREASIYVTASQHTGSTTGVGMTGVYSGTFNLNRFDTTFFQTLKNNEKLELQEIWSSMDKTVGFYTGSITVKKPERVVGGFSNRRLLFTPVGAQAEYEQDVEATIRFFVEDLDADSNMKSYKLPRQLETIIIDEAYYRIKDVQTGTVIIDFDKSRQSTRVSTDGSGMYIQFRTSGLPANRQMTVDLLLVDRGLDRLMKIPEINFRVVS